MAIAVKQPQKRVLGESKAHSSNILPSAEPNKKRKLAPPSPIPPSKFRSPNSSAGKFPSSQPKSQFEEEVLEKLTQDIHGLKQKNAEKDQRWERPSLEDFDAEKDALVFQQIEVEEGTLHGGRTAIKLFGVTEVCADDERTPC